MTGSLAVLEFFPEDRRTERKAILIAVVCFSKGRNSKQLLSNNFLDDNIGICALLYNTYILKNYNST